MNHSYISVSQLVEKLKTNGFIDDNFYAVSVDFDDFQVAEGKFGKFVNVKVLNVSTLTKYYKTLLVFLFNSSLLKLQHTHHYFCTPPM